MDRERLFICLKCFYPNVEQHKNTAVSRHRTEPTQWTGYDRSAMGDEHPMENMSLTRPVTEPLKPNW